MKVGRAFLGRAGSLLDELPGDSGTVMFLSASVAGEKTVLKLSKNGLVVAVISLSILKYLSYEVPPRSDLTRGDSFMTWFMMRCNINVALQYANLSSKLAKIFPSSPEAGHFTELS